MTVLLLKSDTTIQRYSDTAIQRYSDTAIQRYSDTAIQRYSDTAIGDTVIREPEPGTGTAHNLSKLSHFITAGDISDNIFQGGRIISEEFVKISLIYQKQHSGMKSVVYT